ncbi:MAG: hypothetical protein ACLFWL_06500 [Candidatus Brocadiia bacterium]
MSAATINVEHAQRQFVEILPDLENIAHAAFWNLNPADREEAVAETTAMAWQNFFHCCHEDKSPGASSIAYYAVKNVRSGRRFAGSSSTDVMSRKTQQMGRCRVTHTGASADENTDGPTVPLIDHRTWMRPFHRARVELDYPEFLDRPEVTDREERVFEMLADGRLGKEIAEGLQVSQPRVTQIKKSLAGKMMEFFGRGIYPDYHAIKNLKKS